MMDEVRPGATTLAYADATTDAEVGRVRLRARYDRCRRLGRVASVAAVGLSVLVFGVGLVVVRLMPERRDGFLLALAVIEVVYLAVASYAAAGGFRGWAWGVLLFVVAWGLWIATHVVYSLLQSFSERGTLEPEETLVAILALAAAAVLSGVWATVRWAVWRKLG